MAEEAGGELDRWYKSKHINRLTERDFYRVGRGPEAFPTPRIQGAGRLGHLPGRVPVRTG